MTPLSQEQAASSADAVQYLRRIQSSLESLGPAVLPATYNFEFLPASAQERVLGVHHLLSSTPKFP